VSPYALRVVLYGALRRRSLARFVSKARIREAIDDLAAHDQGLARHLAHHVGEAGDNNIDIERIMQWADTYWAQKEGKHR
jgi:hypothetical protein